MTEELQEREREEFTPRGTLFAMMVYIMVLAGMWGVLYWTMISR